MVKGKVSWNRWREAREKFLPTTKTQVTNFLTSFFAQLSSSFFLPAIKYGTFLLAERERIADLIQSPFIFFLKKG